MSDDRYQTVIKFDKDVIINGFITLSTSGLLTISKGYAWDGPSGPTIDTKTFMKGSPPPPPLVHDALYQLMRMKLLPISHKDYADRILQRICKDDGMCRLRAWYVYWGVRLFAKSAVTKPQEGDTQIIEAP